MGFNNAGAVGLRKLNPTYIECITGVLKWKRYILLENHFR